MTSIAISLDKRSYPLMMHLSILPKYGITLEEPIYDPGTQTLKVGVLSVVQLSRCFQKTMMTAKKTIKEPFCCKSFS